MVKNKDWPDSAAPPSGHSPSLSLSVFLSLSLTDAVHPEGTPGSCRGWTPASLEVRVRQYFSCNIGSILIFLKGSRTVGQQRGLAGNLLKILSYYSGILDEDGGLEEFQE